MKVVTINPLALHDLLCEGRKVSAYKIITRLDKQYPLVDAAVDSDGYLKLTFNDGRYERVDVTVTILKSAPKAVDADGLPRRSRREPLPLEEMPGLRARYRPLARRERKRGK